MTTAEASKIILDALPTGYYFRLDETHLGRASENLKSESTHYSVDIYYYGELVHFCMAEPSLDEVVNDVIRYTKEGIRK